MIKIICVCDYYLPGFKGGGPIRTIANMRKALRGEVEISVFTRDRDLGCDSPYAEVPTNSWIETSDGPVFYASPDKFTAYGLKEAIDSKSFEIMYLNSFFSYRGSIEVYHLLKNRFDSMRIILAPRGEFSTAALSLKPLKKHAYLKLCRLFGFYDDVFWHASTTCEKEDIIRQFPSAVDRVYIAEDPVDVGEPKCENIENLRSDFGIFKIAFISRISRMKNLDGLLRILSMTNRRIVLDIFGPIEDDEYWCECKRLAALVPPTVDVTYKGTLAPDHVSLTFGDYDLFAFPTLGENFGHVIFESLRAGTPVLVSERTSWSPDRYGALTVLPLSNESAWVEHLNTVAERSDVQKKQLRQRARDYAENYVKCSGIIEKNLAMFAEVSRKTA